MAKCACRIAHVSLSRCRKHLHQGHESDDGYQDGGHHLHAAVAQSDQVLEGPAHHLRNPEGDRRYIYQHFHFRSPPLGPPRGVISPPLLFRSRVANLRAPEAFAEEEHGSAHRPQVPALDPAAGRHRRQEDQARLNQRPPPLVHTHTCRPPKPLSSRILTALRAHCRSLYF